MPEELKPLDEESFYEKLITLFSETSKTGWGKIEIQNTIKDLWIKHLMEQARRR